MRAVRLVGGRAAGSGSVRFNEGGVVDEEVARGDRRKMWMRRIAGSIFAVD